MSRNIKLWILVALVWTVATFVAGWQLGSPDAPHCPTEDSCTLDYQDGQWHIEPTVP